MLHVVTILNEPQGHPRVTPNMTPLHFSRGGSRISEKGVHLYKGVGVRLADFISFFLNIHSK